mmetsp:Transcript_24715/g.37560  ORF Transcript_24715/g.37560 Transcript_24715/m.37560 type:complete len:146 (-) Transcript_24715:257-694(-)|eukprot:CAMPEP_0178936486 /NCGR_PEP_ID=MMETSP0786-20121207/25212_1 /TAXON_ID=186022 /ORGANISM="Thalassionema frauenfeldii, Strain CCMP 1798" /LENGTH=145 /DNA_ID=CAMNT_0020614919 /DNA_START=10 /DNA_END=447 /DNA_ORIENTATION=+
MRLKIIFSLLVCLLGFQFQEIVGENATVSETKGSCVSNELPEMVETLSNQLKDALKRIEDVEKERDELEASTTKRINNLRMKMIDAADQQKTMETTNRDCAWAYEQVVKREEAAKEESEATTKKLKSRIKKLTEELEKERSKPCS